MAKICISKAKHMTTAALVLMLTLSGCGFGPSATTNSNSSSAVAAGFAASSVPIWSNDQFNIGTMTVSFDVIPLFSAASGEDSVIGLSNGPATGYTSLAAIVLFGANGIQARNGSSYQALVNTPYEVNTSYHMQMDVNVTSHTYSVYVTPSGGAQILLAQNYAFRTEQAAITSLTNFAYYSDVGAVTVSNLNIAISLLNPAPSASPTPTSTPAPVATPTPTATPVIASTGFPNASNTGIPAGVTLKSASSNTLSAPGTYSGLSFTGVVSITASNVTLQNCLINGTNTDYFELEIAAGLTNVVVQNCEIAGAGANSVQTGVYGVYVPGDSQVTLNALNIHGVGSPFTISDGRILIENSYAHDFYSGPATHYNGVQYNGGGSADFSLVIQNNTIINNQIQTDAIMLDNYFGPVNNVTINHNYLSGGDFTIYCDGHFNSNPITNITITNNTMGTGYYGYFDINASSTSPKTSGNVDALTGVAIAP
jgi:hypothetical protein